MFIYVCLVRRNFPFKLDLNQGFLGLGLSFLLLTRVSRPELKSFLGHRGFSAGADLTDESNLSLFLFLAILLLVMLLVVVRRRGAGSVKIDS